MFCESVSETFQSCLEMGLGRFQNNSTMILAEGRCKILANFIQVIFKRPPFLRAPFEAPERLAPAHLQLFSPPCFERCRVLFLVAPRLKTLRGHRALPLFF